jgi:hypothetical protein
MHKGDNSLNRSEIYQERYYRFLDKIRAYQNEEVQKIQDKSKDEIEFE